MSFLSLYYNRIISILQDANANKKLIQAHNYNKMLAKKYPRGYNTF